MFNMKRAVMTSWLTSGAVIAIVFLAVLASGPVSAQSANAGAANAALDACLAAIADAGLASREALSAAC
jgi:hypothetical protein